MISTFASTLGQPRPLIADPPMRVWNGSPELPEGEYALIGIESGTALKLPKRGRIIIADATLAGIGLQTQDPGDLEVALVRTRVINCSVAIEAPRACRSFAMRDCTVEYVPGVVRQSFLYLNVLENILIDGLTVLGGRTNTNLQHSCDLAINSPSGTMSVRRYIGAADSTTDFNLHLKVGGQDRFWLGESILLGRVGIDAASTKNDDSAHLRCLWMRYVTFDNRQTTTPSQLAAIWPCHTIEEIDADETVLVLCKDPGWRGWCPSPEWGNRVPKVTGKLPWGADGKLLSTSTPPVVVPPPSPVVIPPTPKALTSLELPFGTVKGDDGSEWNAVLKLSKK